MAAAAPKSVYPALISRTVCVVIGIGPVFPLTVPWPELVNSQDQNGTPKSMLDETDGVDVISRDRPGVDGRNGFARLISPSFSALTSVLISAVLGMNHPWRIWGTSCSYPDGCPFGPLQMDKNTIVLVRPCPKASDERDPRIWLEFVDVKLETEQLFEDSVAFVGATSKY